MKKVICILTAIIAVFSFYGCQKQEKTTKEDFESYIEAEFDDRDSNYEKNGSDNYISTEGNYNVPAGAKVIDIFKDFEQYIYYSGYNGAGVASIRIPDGTTLEFGDYYFVVDVSPQNKTSTPYSTYFQIIKNNERIGFVHFRNINDSSYTAFEKLSEGDRFTFEWRMDSADEEKLHADNVYFKTKSKTFIAPDFGDLMELNDLTNEDIETIKSDIPKIDIHLKDKDYVVTDIKCYKAKPTAAIKPEFVRLVVIYYDIIDDTNINNNYAYAYGIDKTKNGVLDYTMCVTTGDFLENSLGYSVNYQKNSDIYNEIPNNF